MRVFVLVSCLLAGALARPEAGYTYNGLLQNAASLHQQLPTEHAFANFAAPPPTTYGTPLNGEPTLNNIEQNAEIGAAEGGNQFQHQHQAVQPLPLDQQDSYNAAYQHSSIDQDGGYPYAPQPTTVHKHVYVHVPPKDFEDEDVIETRVRHAPAAKQNTTRSSSSKHPHQHPYVHQWCHHHHKTKRRLIYVLHKKPEAVKDIVIPTAAPTKPSKPEVYFIKYKTKKEEAPVYGPPPQQQQDQQQQQNGNSINGADLDPRHSDVPAGEYGAPAADEYSADLTAPLTTIQPALEQEQSPALEQQPQFVSDLPADAFDLPTALPFAAVAGDQPQPTAPAPSNQYLAPEAVGMAPIVVEEPTHLPSSNYGPPTSNRFFLKKK
ncbi:unnamed protein product [Ceratitis capitata]|uniref:(Mediterranean fruit fly) hypothetical protein n=1 Tax=Ceratitis capitata TaxID=7213 RepID=A0A811U7A8_CERCA|nr:unnamed protein product [Ceratitis capitata]